MMMMVMMIMMMTGVFALGRQVAGRLHVEVVRVGGGFEEGMAGGDDSESSPDGEAQERKLVCMVRASPTHQIMHTHSPLSSSSTASLDSLTPYLALSYHCLPPPRRSTPSSLSDQDPPGHRSSPVPVQLCVLPVLLLGPIRAHHRGARGRSFCLLPPQQGSSLHGGFRQLQGYTCTHASHPSNTYATLTQKHTDSSFLLPSPGAGCGCDRGLH